MMTMMEWDEPRLQSTPMSGIVWVSFLSCWVDLVHCILCAFCLPLVALPSLSATLIEDSLHDVVRLGRRKWNENADVMMPSSSSFPYLWETNDSRCYFLYLLYLPLYLLMHSFLFLPSFLGKRPDHQSSGMDRKRWCGPIVHCNSMS